MKVTAMLMSVVVCAGMAMAQTEQPTTTHRAKTTTQTTTKPTTPHTDANKDGHNNDPATQAARDEFQKSGSLAPEHIELARNLTGNWTAVCTMRESPAGPAMTSHATATFDPVFGGRYIRQTYHGDVMGIDFNGEGLYTFNKGSKKFECSWFDSSAPGVMLSSGVKNDKGEIAFGGSYDCPMTGEKKTGKSIMRFDSKTQMTFEMWTVASDGAEFKAMEVVYTKADPGSTTVSPNRGNAPTTILAPKTTTPSTTNPSATTPANPTTPKADPR